MKQWWVRAGSPRNWFQALLCWCLGWDVYYGETPPWKRPPPDLPNPNPQEKPAEPVLMPKPYVPIPKERPSI